MENKKEKKFFVKRFFFWVLVIINWSLGIIVSRNYDPTYIIASFFGSFVLFFVLGLIVWGILKIVRKIRKQ